MFFQYLKFVRNPSHMELQEAVNQGRRCTWEKLSAIKANCAIELALYESVALLNDMRLKRSLERAGSSHGHASTVKFRASRRIPSWNCIARENSSGSLDEESLNDTNTLNHKGVSHVSGPLSRGDCNEISLHDASDTESESIELNSWTRSGGPLMRTASANKFINFMQNLDIYSDFISLQRDDEVDGLAAHSNSFGTRSEKRDSCYKNSRVSTDRSSVNSDSDSCKSVSRLPMASTRILVAEGDLLQPERIHDDIVLNILRRNDLSFPHRNSGSEQQQNSSTEVDVEVMQIENGDASSTSDYGDNNGFDLNCISTASDHHVGDSSGDHEVDI